MMMMAVKSANFKDGEEEWWLEAGRERSEKGVGRRSALVGF